ncbi:MAG: tRNA (adenosine(37)-N6)-threonylcarbamoyltransferase complex dimerization subunit type 1 TsaB [Betaproteobacteria bacterium]|nr:tRNA (adenosine(37)-N6)-threonylcarbamoyltransferase complex dimerization subunit type 1 TsaB [Betaproteobacteria bacterium]
MKILALDTSTEHCSVALWSDGALDARETRAGQSHSEMLLAMVDELLARNRLRADGLDAVAFGAGPGSFTGLRIACGVAQGLALGAGLPVVGVSTLVAMAQAAGGERAVCCLDARMGEIYHGAYERAGEEWRTVHEPSLCAPEAAPQLPAGMWTGCGSGFAAHGAALARRYAGRLAAVIPKAYPHAREIAQIAARAVAQGRTVAPGQAAPVYIRDKVALRSDERR